MNVLCHTERIAGFRHVTETYGGIQIVETVNNSDSSFKCFGIGSQILPDADIDIDIIILHGRNLKYRYRECQTARLRGLPLLPFRRNGRRPDASDDRRW